MNPPVATLSDANAQDDVSIFADWDRRAAAGRRDSQPNAADLTTPPPSTGDRLERYAHNALESMCAELSAIHIGDGRNEALNRLGLRAYRMAEAGWIDAQRVTDALGAADGGADYPATARTLRSAREAAARLGPAEPPPMTQAAPAQSDDPFAPGFTAISESPTPAHGDDARASTWEPVDLTPFLEGTYEAPEADLMRRTDGIGLLYSGLVHSVHGESESGKSLALQAVAADLINDGGDVLFVDFESDPGSIVQRLRDLGAADDAIRDRFRYAQPQTRPDASPTDAAAWAALLAQSFRLAVIDGVTDALAVYGYGTKENDEITAWMRAMPKTIADQTGAAVVIIDHVTKDAEGRGRFAIGGQAKLAGLTGAAYTASIGEQLGRGLRGTIVLRIAKDRPGAIRPHCGPFRKADRTAEAARIIVDSTGDGPATVEIATWKPPGTAAAGDTFRPTALMERVSRHVENNPDSTSNDIVAGVSGQRRSVLAAVKTLVDEGFIAAVAGPRGATRHTHVRAYTQVDDPLSDVAQTGTSDPFDPVSQAA